MDRRRATFVGTGVKPDYDRSIRWQERAACQSAPEVDKQILTGYPSREDAYDLKRRYCDNCPVVTQCLNWAYDDRHFTGIAGGRVFSGDKSTGQSRRVQKLDEE